MKDDVDGVFLPRLQAIMEERGLKQIDICKLTNLSSSQMHHIVSGRTKSPSLSTACRIAVALDVSLDYFAGLIDEPRPIRRDEDGNPVFSDEERELIGLYRETDERGQRTVMRAAQGAAEDFPGGRAEEAPADTSDVISA